MMKPTAEFQLIFLSKIQRIFHEGDFAATYKFALLSAITNICVQKKLSQTSTPEISFKEIALEFVELYWQQTNPFRSNESNTVLFQNTGSQAAVITYIIDFKNTTGIQNLSQATGHEKFKELINKVSTTVSAQPVNFLQNIGGQTDEFIYFRNRSGYIQLQSGVAYCFECFYQLIQELCRSAWLNKVRKYSQNTPLLGQHDDLESFLFNSNRASLKKVSEKLLSLDDKKCFYCGLRIHEVDIDHFIPFSYYPKDLIHNFVISHPTCNRSKSDTLASYAHLERWIERCQKLNDDLIEIAIYSGIKSDFQLSISIKNWLYKNAIEYKSRAWIKPKNYELIDHKYDNLIF